MRLQACLNGARAPGFHPALPLTPEAVARDAAACVAAGAVALHLHPRNTSLRETLEPDPVAATMRALRAAVPGVPVSLSTGDWIMADDPLRRRCIAGWAALGEARPEEASVNLSEADAPAVMEALLSAGVGVEAGLASEGDAERLAATGLAPRCRRILVEIPPEGDAALAGRILARLETVAPGIERQVHGEEASAWPLLLFAAARGVTGRIGLEDVGFGPDGMPVAGNAALVAAALSDG